MNGPRIVITGMGAVSVLGTGLRPFWAGLIAGRSGIRRIQQFDTSHMPCQIAGEVPGFEAELYMERKEARRVPRSAQMAFAAAKMAVEGAGLSAPFPDPERAGVSFGTAIGGGGPPRDWHVTRPSPSHWRFKPLLPSTSPPQPSACSGFPGSSLLRPDTST